MSLIRFYSNDQECDAYEAKGVDELLASLGYDTICPQCKHAMHEPGKCLNIASDGECDCGELFRRNK